MAPHSNTLAWKIPWMEEPGRLQSMGSLRVGNDWATSLSLFTFIGWRRKWQPTPVFLPGESQEWGSLVGCCLWGHTESGTTEVLAAAALDFNYYVNWCFKHIYFVTTFLGIVKKHILSLTNYYFISLMYCIITPFPLHEVYKCLSLNTTLLM